MDAPLLTLIALAALLIGAAIGWFVRAGRSAEEVSSARARAAGAESLVQGLREQLAHARSRDDERMERERRDHAVLTALAPVRETLQTMQRQVAELERERGVQYGTIAAQLRLALESDEQLRQTTESLASALRSNGTRGVWGEAALRRVVEAAGLTRHVDFTTQTTLSSGAARPDMIIRLPGEKAIPVDAKVPLDAYLEAVAIPETAIGADLERRRALMQRHVKAIRGHVDALSRKAYWSALETAPEFVICFIPNESLLASALDEDPTLLDYAFGKQVALASPVNLWAVLKTIAYTWTQQEVSAEARTLFELGTTLYERLGSLSGHAESLRRAIERTISSYNDLVGSLESRVLVTARRFPGIDETKILAEPATITSAPRPLAAPELTGSRPELDGSEAIADLGELRERL